LPYSTYTCVGSPSAVPSSTTAGIWSIIGIVIKTKTYVFWPY
jgi:hypothetical protein